MKKPTLVRAVSGETVEPAEPAEPANNRKARKSGARLAGPRAPEFRQATRGARRNVNALAQAHDSAASQLSVIRFHAINTGSADIAARLDAILAELGEARDAIAQRYERMK